MKKFLLKLLLFISIFISIFAFMFSVITLLPPTPRTSKSLLFAKTNKDSLLQNIPPPRIIFIGGSNLSFGLNSKMIKDSLSLNPINTGIHGNIGLIYMMDNTLPYIKSGDIVVVSPEYQQFYGTTAYGKAELLRTIIDVSPSTMSMLRIKQWANIIKYLPGFAITKFKPTEYFNLEESINFEERVVYSVNSFNEYGDVYTHWNLEKRNFSPDDSIDLEFNYSVINELSNFKNKLAEKGAVLFITFPGYQSASFENNRAQIMRIETELKEKGFVLLGTPDKYKIPESLMFNSTYHLSKKGVDYKTQLLIEDLENVLAVKQAASSKQIIQQDAARHVDN